jgi:hypothetical protein
MRSCWFAVGLSLACAAAPLGAAPSRFSAGGLGLRTLQGDAQAGISAFAAAGDVDGDGLADILVRYSARRFDAPDWVVLLYGAPHPAGPVDPFAAGVRRTLLVTARTSPATDLQERQSTGLAGGHDVTGDGVPDLLIANQLEPEVGAPAVLLIHGGELPEEILSFQLGAGIPGSFLVNRTAQGDFLGQLIDIVPDLNGDGLAEIVIADPGHLTHRGRAFVIFGAAGMPRFVEIAETGDSLPGFLVDGGDRILLQGIAGLGDIDGDGFGDLGLAVLDERSGNHTAYIIFGREEMPAIIRPGDGPGPHLRQLPEFRRIQSAGDFDGDGRSDVVLDLADRSPFSHGWAYILFGRARALLPEVIDKDVFAERGLGSIIREPRDVTGGGGFGTGTPSFALAPGRDLDGDGKAELCISAAAARHVIAGPAVAVSGGAAFLFRGGTVLPPSLGTADIARGLGVQIDGVEPFGRLGTAATLLDDFDGDGQGEILLASFFDEGCAYGDRGLDYKLWLVPARLLAARPPPRLGRIYPDSGPAGGGNEVLCLGTGFGDAPRVFFGQLEAEVLRVLGEGVLVARAPPAGPVLSRAEVRVQTSAGQRTGTLFYAYRQGRTIPVGPGRPRSFEIRHAQTSPSAGRGLAAGDFDGDGKPDAALLDLSPAGVYELHIVFGTGGRGPDISLDDLAPPQGVTFTLPASVAHVPALTAAGDLNGDGAEELILRLDWRASGRVEWLVLLGRPEFPAGGPLIGLEGTLRVFSDEEGFVADGMGAGPDLDQDGFDDLLLAGRRGNRSLLFVVRGGPKLPAELSLDGLAEEGRGARLESDLLLTRIAGRAGDFNGDGWEDVFFAGNGVIQAGAVAVIYGNPFLFEGRGLLLNRGFFGDAGGLLVAGGSPLGGQLFTAAFPGDLDGDGRGELFFRREDGEGCTLSPRAGGGVILDREALLEAGIPAELLPVANSLYGGRLAGLPDFVPGGAAPRERVLALSNTVGAEALGAAAAPAGDFDGDGYRDLLLCAPGLSPQDASPRPCYLLRGGPGLHDSPSLAFPFLEERAIRLDSPAGTPAFGTFAAGGFDWDGDGAGDLLIGAANGTAYVVFGEAGEVDFVRGDADGNREVLLTDAVITFQFLFQGGVRPPCLDAVDADDDGAINITDGIYTLRFLFLGGPPPPPPFPVPGHCGRPPPPPRGNRGPRELRSCALLAHPPGTPS